MESWLVWLPKAVTHRLGWEITACWGQDLRPHRARRAKEGRPVCAIWYAEALSTNEQPGRCLSLDHLYYQILHRTRQNGNWKQVQRQDFASSFRDSVCSFPVQSSDVPGLSGPLLVHTIVFTHFPPLLHLKWDHSQSDPLSLTSLVLNCLPHMGYLWPNAFTCPHAIRVSLNCRLDCFWLTVGRASSAQLHIPLLVLKFLGIFCFLNRKRISDKLWKNLLRKVLGLVNSQELETLLKF